MIRSPGRGRFAPVAAACLLGAATLMVSEATVAVAGPSTANATLTAGVEDEGADCPVSLPGSPTANPKLPDPFKRIDGGRIATRSDWRCRREEISKLAQRYVYGTKPAKPAAVTGTVTRTSITVNVSDGGKSSSFSASVSLPSGTGPFPAVLVYGGLGADTATIHAAGVATINYYDNDRS
ncbi:hypothetical protein [Kutzneria kofuensis]|uniref:4-O-methyl-glucuronoyl methylesterase-like domain-containing protein n=1 Tax=Kutzneria kofuensis TaxID=103725 RepID=A0A7W9KPM9_9PSEU|nr:hypothetical protein [Kutzneria kofuensis]MBB5896337.1 hypothetical protein [Kutzneria kofuensis]